MSKERFFDFQRRNIFATANDNLFLAIDHENVTVFINRGHIAGVKPSAAHGFGGGLWLAPIALHDHVAAGHDFANAFAVVGHVLVVWVDDAKLDSGDCKAGHGLADVLLVALPIETGLHSGNGKRRRSLREAIAGETAPAKFSFDLAHKRRR